MDANKRLEVFILIMSLIIINTIIIGFYITIQEIRKQHETTIKLENDTEHEILLKIKTTKLIEVE